MNKSKIMILFGGCSSEYKVSLQSAYAVICNLDETRYEPVLIGIDFKGHWYLFEGNRDTIPEDTWWEQKECYPAVVSMDKELHGIMVFRNGFENGAQLLSVDAAFPVLHGKNGEDGTMQGVLELAGIPIVGCHTLASAVCMDKEMAHRLVKAAGVKVPRSVLIRKETSVMAKEAAEVLQYPLFVKPLRAGSSFGITKVTKPEQLDQALELAFSYDTSVVMEEMIDGFEVGCAVLGTKELFVGAVDEIELSEGFFDYTEKYTLKSSKIHVPARVEEETAGRIKETAKLIYRSLDCSGFARVDMFLTPAGEIYFNEVNTIPGFTEHSRYPGMMRQAGLDFGGLVNRLTEMALQGE